MVKKIRGVMFEENLKNSMGLEFVNLSHRFGYQSPITFAYFPWNWDRGDGCIVRLVAITDPTGKYRIEKGSKF